MQYDCVITMGWIVSVDADTYKEAIKAAHKEADDIMESLKMLGVDLDVYHKPEIDAVVVRGIDD